MDNVIKQFAAVFTEWERRYRENPELFWSEAQKLLKETPETYGDAAAPYFIKVAMDLGIPIGAGGIMTDDARR